MSRVLIRTYTGKVAHYSYGKHCWDMSLCGVYGEAESQRGLAKLPLCKHCARLDGKGVQA